MSKEALVHIRKTHRIAVLGESEVGKSTLAERLVQLITDREPFTGQDKKLKDAVFATASQMGVLDTAQGERCTVTYDNDESSESEVEMEQERALGRDEIEAMRDENREEGGEGGESVECTGRQMRRMAAFRRGKKREDERRCEEEEGEKRGKQDGKKEGKKEKEGRQDDKGKKKKRERKVYMQVTHEESSEEEKTVERSFDMTQLYRTTTQHTIREHTPVRKVHMREAIVEIVDPIEEGRLARYQAKDVDAAVVLFDSDDEDAVSKTENWCHTARGLGAKKVYVVRRRERRNPKAIWKHMKGADLRKKKRRLRRERKNREKDRRAKEVFKAAKKMNAKPMTEEDVAKQSIIVAKKAALTQVNTKCLLL